MNIKDQIKRYKSGELNSREGLELLDMLLAQQTGLDLKEKIETEIQRRSLTTAKQLAIIDAACEVAAFSKQNAYPQEGTPLFFDFAQKLDALATAINAEYSNFNRNVCMGGANK